MVAVCPTTRLVNMQTLESSKAAGWVDAFTRLCCEVGCPSLVFCDMDSAGMSGFNMSEFEIRDLTLTLHRERGIKMSLCPVSGHDKHGHVERVIRSVQEGFNDSGLKTKLFMQLAYKLYVNWLKCSTITFQLDTTTLAVQITLHSLK